MISTGTEVMSLPSGMQNVLDSGRLNCLRHLPPMTEIRIEMYRIRIRKIPDSNSTQIWVDFGDDDGGRHGVVGVFGMLKGSKSRLLEMMMMMMGMIPRIRYEDGRNY